MSRGGRRTGSGDVSRRTFVRVVSAAGAGLTLGISLEGCSTGPEVPPSDATFAPDAWLRIDEDGEITFVVGKSEMGQGVTTALPQLLAEELGVSLDDVRLVFAPPHEAYADPELGMQVTGGSTSVATSWEPLRRAGATAREMLRAAAAQRWQVPVAEVEMGAGSAHAGERSATFGELAAAAAGMIPPEDVRLKDPSEFTLVGTSHPRLDVPDKTTGRTVFGLDAGPEARSVAVVARSPVFGGRLVSFDATEALEVEGVHDVFEIASGVAVVAEGYWPATKGREALSLEWDEGEGAGLDDAEIADRMRAALDEGGKAARDDGDVETTLSEGVTVEAEYALPYLAHATMEPMNCTAEVRGGRCRVWAPTQFQDAPGYLGGGSRGAAAEAAGVSPGDVEVHTTYMGGGFGRRSELDFVSEAAEIAARVEGAVKVVWSREDDTQHDFYRPASRHRLRATLDGDGAPLAWRHDMALQSILEKWMPGWMPTFVASWAGFMPGGIDPTCVEGAQNQPYDIPNVRVAWANVKLPVPVGFWRSVGNSHNGFVVESFVDELAHEAGADPYEYRRELLRDAPRHRAVLDAVAEAADWGSPGPEGRAKGIAVVESFGSFVAQVAEVSVSEGTTRVHKVWCAVDCGTVVNPAIVRAQMESAIIYGLTAALHGKIEIQNGRAVQSNFHDYPMIRMADAPEVEVVLAPSGDAPGGVGEPGLPPIAPAVTNALFALTGERVRELPVRLG